MAKILPIYEFSNKCTCKPLVRGVEAGQLSLAALVRDRYPGRKLARGALSGVCTVGCWDAAHPQDWGLDYHRDPGIEITFLETGSNGFAVEDQSFDLQPDDMTFTRPWQRHRVGNLHVSAGRLHWLILDVKACRPHQPWRWPPWLVLTPADRNELTNMLRHNEQPVWHATPKIRGCFQQIATAIEADRDGSSISRLTVLLNDLFLNVLEMFRGRDVPLDESLSLTQRTVELFLADLGADLQQLAEEWTVRRMARSCGLGVTQFVYYCKQLTNMTPVRYLNHLRLEAAAKLLKERPELGVTKVALVCGFSSGQYFSTAFRRHFGVAPRDFQSQSSE